MFPLSSVEGKIKRQKHFKVFFNMRQFVRVWDIEFLQNVSNHDYSILRLTC